MNNFIIGILGGMGTYATINVFQKYAEIFPAKKEWDRPRIIIDNNCTMPSRVKAYFDKENKENLIKQMLNSLTLLKQAGCSKIILACNTSHLFLNEIYKFDPTLKEYIVNIIDETVNKINQDNLKDVYLLGSEATINSKIYQNKIKNLHIPSEDDYSKIRICIEAVKQNNITSDIIQTFLSLLKNKDNIILGCTELPVLVKYINIEKNFLDPIEITLKNIKENI